jgi:hypothetical protein
MNLNIKNGNIVYILNKEFFFLQIFGTYINMKSLFVLFQQVKSLNGMTELICWSCRLICNVSYIY